VQINGQLAVAEGNLKQAEANEQAAQTAKQTGFQAALNVIRSGNPAEARRALDIARAQSREGREAQRAAENQYSEIKGKLAFYYSGDFYFGFLESPVQTAETDAEGKFAIEVPHTGRFSL
jgi:hypothetical protein